MTHLVLVRHGETIWHADNRYVGVSDIALTPRGQQQAQALAKWAATAKLDAIWVSTLSRAKQTADPAAQALNLAPHTDARLSEINFGKVEGYTAAEINQLFPGVMTAFVQDPVANHMPGGEDPRQAAQRAVACFNDIAKTHADSRVLVVMHNTLIRLALCQMLGIPLNKYRVALPSIANGALTEIRIDGPDTGLLQFNTPLHAP